MTPPLLLLRRLALCAALGFALAGPAVLPATDAGRAEAAQTQTQKKASAAASKKTSAKKKTTQKKASQEKSTAKKSTAKTTKATAGKSTKKTTKKASTAKKSAAAPKAPPASAATEKEKAKAESAKASVDRRLDDLRRELAAKEASQEKAHAELERADKAVSDANRRLRTLKTERQTVEKRLRDLTRDSKTVSRELSDAEELVAQIARAQYAHSRRRSWQSFIEGTNPSRLALESAQLRYLARAQVRAASDLESKQERIRSVAAETKSRRSELERISREEEQGRRELLKEKKDRQAAANRLKSEIASQQAAITELAKDQARLGNLVATIDNRLRREKAAEAKAKAAERRAAEERRRTQPAVRQPAPGTSLAKLKGRLTRPADGRIAASFGQTRSGSSKWLGIKIRAPEGADVRACAPGRVVFADWLRGYGNLIIVDHGNTYLSVYANNESVFKNVGDSVKQGETIGSVGTSGSDDEPGLYFEIRHGGKPVNPAPWLSK